HYLCFRSSLRYMMMNLALLVSDLRAAVFNFGFDFSNHFVLRRHLRTHAFDIRLQSCESSHRDIPVKLRVLISDSLTETLPYLNRINCLYQGFRPHSVIESDLRNMLEPPS